MKTFLAIAGAILFAASTALAAPASPCTDASLATYITLGATGCTEGSGASELLFSDFSLAGDVASSNIDVVIPAAPPAPEGTLEFTSGAWDVSSPTEVDSSISFVVSTVSGAATLTGIGLSDDGVFTGSGIASVSENYCLNSDTTIGCSPSEAGTLAVSNPPANDDGTNSVGFSAGASEVAVTKDVTVNAVQAGSTADISDVYNTYPVSSVPEPMSYVLLGSGLLGLGLMRKRVQRG